MTVSINIHLVTSISQSGNQIKKKNYAYSTHFLPPRDIEPFLDQGVPGISCPINRQSQPQLGIASD